MIKGDRKVRKYLAIGHFKENKNITCVASKSYTLKEFRKDLCGNGFIPYVVITEKMMKKYLNLIAWICSIRLRKWLLIIEFGMMLQII